jgi:hypothetical protein
MKTNTQQTWEERFDSIFKRWCASWKTLRGTPNAKTAIRNLISQLEAEAVERVKQGRIYTGYCDKNGDKIFYGDTLEFNDSSGAIWQSSVVHEDGYATVSRLDVVCIKNPKDWKEKHDWTKSRWWSTLVGYGEMGSWNCARATLPDIAGYFKNSDEMFAVRDKFNKKYGKFHSNRHLQRELPVKIVKSGDLKEWQKQDIFNQFSAITHSVKYEKAKSE